MSLNIYNQRSELKNQSEKDAFMIQQYKEKFNAVADAFPALASNFVFFLE
jgi:hypothetical protein